MTRTRSAGAPDGPDPATPARFTVGELTAGLGVLTGDGSATVEALAIDSRRVEAGTLFVALRGLRTDGHRFVADAARRGAAGVVVEEAIDLGSVPVVRVDSTARGLARVAGRFHRHPSRELDLFGVTGTNGKTTVTHMVAAALEAAATPAAVLGTLGAGRRQHAESIGYTTPTADRFQAILRRLADTGVRAVATEVSSHALKTQRTFGTRFRVVAFVNLTRDHLDFHGDEADYRESKLRLFDREARGDESAVTAVVNLDDSEAPAFVERAGRSGDEIVRVGHGPTADVRAADVRLGPDGSLLVVRFRGGEVPLRLSLPGAFNVQNALVAFAMATAAGVAPERAAAGLESVLGVPGRLERVDDGGGGVRVLVDYAHTPDALEIVLTTVRSITAGRLIAVFGCGGDRDRGKRPIMAGIGARLADVALLTSDNPRTEEPAAILADMEAGVPAGSRYEIIVDRRDAIRRAVELAAAGDAIVIAGKGHEPVQIVGDEELPFDDREEARQALAEAGLLGDRA